MHDIFITQINHENQKFCCDKYQASRKSESAKNVFSLTQKMFKIPSYDDLLLCRIVVFRKNLPV